MVKNLPVMQETQFQSLDREDSLGEENGYPLQCYCLENPLNRGAWRVIVDGVARCQRRLATNTNPK